MEDGLPIVSGWSRITFGARLHQCVWRATIASLFRSLASAGYYLGGGSLDLVRPSPGADRARAAASGWLRDRSDGSTSRPYGGEARAGFLARLRLRSRGDSRACTLDSRF